MKSRIYDLCLTPYICFISCVFLLYSMRITQTIARPGEIEVPHIEIRTLMYKRCLEKRRQYYLTTCFVATGNEGVMVDVVLWITLIWENICLSLCMHIGLMYWWTVVVIMLLCTTFILDVTFNWKGNNSYYGSLTSMLAKGRART